ncbi:MAG TPA: tRNA pseudouridine(38-40) synthase TruA [Dehalococcoidia bacterium]|nr:tRNA pseudouridine(38-40) synthase TruA [Dehalococcoidia bacterium]
MAADEKGDEAPTRRIALVIEYEGTAYAGSQYQRNSRTVQGELEKALRKLTRKAIRVALAGRTDAGVHAKGQVAAFLTTVPYELGVFQRALNSHLPKDIAVRSAHEVTLGFDVRRSARRRWYRYRIYNGHSRRPLFRSQSWHVPEPLDVEAMREAAQLMVGRQDFAALSAPAAGRSTVRTVHRSEVRRHRCWVVVDIEANAFLPQQVRRTVGALVRVGQGKETVEGFRRLLASARPGAATFAAPAAGLCLMAVRYEDVDLGNTEENPDI